MTKAIIFGANGQDGYYLNLLCLEKGIEPIGFSRSGSGILGDVADYSKVEQIVRDNHPAYIFHLAANSTTHHAALFENHSTISTGTINILEAVRLYAPAARVFIAGSGLQFKNYGKPIAEHNEFSATSAYSVARIQSAYAARYFRSLGIKTYVGYLFHHESPFRKPSHISRMVVDAVLKISNGSNVKLELGDISVAKEWAFARDVVEGILTLVQQDDVFEAVIGSGKSYTIEQWLECCFSLIGRDWRDHVILKGGFIAEYPRLVSNPATMARLGWTSKTDLETLATIMMAKSMHLS